MQAYLVQTSRHIVSIISLALLLITITSCSVFHAPVKEPAQQAAQYLLQKIDRQKLTSNAQIRSFIKDKTSVRPLPNNTKKALKKYPDIAADLLLAMSKSENPQQGAMQLITRQKKQQSNYVYVALTLFPIEGYRFAEKLSLSDHISNEAITTASLRAGFDPALIFPATAANDDDYRIVPLMQSASITLYNQTQTTTADIQFKAVADNEWQPGLALQWEPIQGALSGSIVYLQPDTEYQVKVTRTENNEPLSEQEYTFTTRAESPPIDPDKIYYLSDIYQGGQFNLEALGIEGTANGWAKIIGDGVTVQADENDDAAIYLGRQNYVMLENVTTKGGERYGIQGYKGHHIWIKGCNVSAYGRIADEYRNGKGYETVNNTGLINYDSGIYLERSGVVVIEECEIHSPNGNANSWEYGHPNGPNAFQIWGKHDTEAYRGQYIVRNNRFYGAPEHRFNDVIEGRGNFDRAGAFVRDSAIYNNYLAYANDDLIEIDGGQSNVLVYNNEMTQGYCGISAAPNMIGPSYIFHNYIHDLGDERGKEWTAIKMGGIMTRPAGITNVFENLIITNRNGISASKVDNDDTFWVNAVNNIFITRDYGSQVGYGIYDKQLYAQSTFKNNVIYNTDVDIPVVKATIGDDFYHPMSEQPEEIAAVTQAGAAYRLNIDQRFLIPNFSLVQSSSASADALAQETSADNSPAPIYLDAADVSSFDNQDSQGNYEITPEGSHITLYGNTWKSLTHSNIISPDTMVDVDVTHNGLGEIIGMGFETDNALTNWRLFKFFGSQAWQENGPKSTQTNTTETLTFNLGQFVTGPINRLVFTLDNDDNQGSVVPQATFGNIKIYEPITEPDVAGAYEDTEVMVGIVQ